MRRCWRGSTALSKTSGTVEQYLAAQYEVAKNARLETLEDGTLLLVMSEGQDALFDAIRDSIEKAG